MTEQHMHLVIVGKIILGDGVGFYWLWIEWFLQMLSEEMDR